MKFLKHLYRETLGELIDEIKESVEELKSEIVQPFSEIVDEIKSIGSSIFGRDDEENEEYDEDSDFELPEPSKTRVHACSRVKSGNSTMKVTIKGVYQMNGPKPFCREISCSQSEVGYYSQLMGNKSKQAQWIRANFPGANTERGFSMSINIK